MSTSISTISSGSSGSAIAASLTTSLLSSTPTTTGTPKDMSGSHGVPPSQASTKQTVILSVVFAGWAVIALVLFVLVARRRGKLLQEQDMEAMLAEQQIQALGMHTPYARMPLGTEYQPTRRARQLPVLKTSELALIPVIPAAEYLGKISAECENKKGEPDGGDEEQPVCVVCLEQLSASDEKVRVLGCGHAFHPPCIDKWLLKRSCRCPLCNLDTKSALGLPGHPSSAKLAD
ncbi:hypothetical protein IW140_003287 [Coemansia sp. RSA 1813]|nr:hypothetical protein EV178_002906 [Coemansia sp. RSA 1646]KAJ1771697.1 hypothetical protein LPJ74_002124 [Coemansia sp. RSA 1843]KAJ2089667.1 hypothetical protein IW138_003265 [Coemansia sp. RSA 986]KAJ2214137.1 hypothetical protein EV179_003276 [Coemansia sp. RSA 487]KAJ2569195.1 hypothetical protein IW140_003287 [Coemansia sp. RSA 1813]